MRTSSKSDQRTVDFVNPLPGLFMPARVVFIFLLLLFVITQCATREGNDLKKRDKKKEFYHFFSNQITKDHFVLELEGEEVLLGKLHLLIFSYDGKKIYDHNWEVSNYFWKVENHYLDEAAQVELFWKIFDHYFDEENFSPISKMKITGSLKNSDQIFIHDLATDSTSIGLSLEVQDYCISFSKKYNTCVLLRAIRKDILKKYGIQ